MDCQLRTWDYPNRLPNMLFDLSPAPFYQFLLRYKLAQVRLFDASLRQLEAFKAARKKYARIPVEDGDPYISSEVLEARLRTHRERELQNELPDKAA